MRAKWHAFTFSNDIVHSAALFEKSTFKHRGKRAMGRLRRRANVPGCVQAGGVLSSQPPPTGSDHDTEKRGWGRGMGVALVNMQSPSADRQGERRRRERMERDSTGEEERAILLLSNWTHCEGST